VQGLAERQGLTEYDFELKRFKIAIHLGTGRSRPDNTRKETSMSATTWNLDGTHSQVEFSVKHMMFTTVRGRFGQMEGSIALNTEAPEESSVEVTIDAASLDTRVEDRDNLLRSPDFFDVEAYPALTFRSRRIEGSLENSGDAFKVVGDLTIRGVTKEVVLDARFEGAVQAQGAAEEVMETAAAETAAV
jgi:polyisoprenoid-binding protein YceI